MNGSVALHGGGEFLPGDEPFLRAILDTARRARNGRLRAIVVPVAAANHGPEPAARLGVEALTRAAAAAKIDATVEAALVVDAASAADPEIRGILASADLVHLPGGDPALVPEILAGSAAWEAILEAHRDGATIAGASAGAMGLAEITWTPRGFRPGLGLVSGFVVVPHFEAFDRRGREADIEQVRGAGLGALGLDERTGVVRGADGRWLVHGPGRAVWMPHGGEDIVGRAGDGLPIGS